jgi:uncharacterized oligopeptide transporter (OPT) family protein
MSSTSPKPSFLPAMGSTGYYVLLGVVAIFILGPLGGITAAYMNFSLGFFVGGQVLAGILGSIVTLGYGPEGRHGANYMQTMAASVASMAAMGVLIQAMIWLGLPEPATWKLVVYFLTIGMFGVGVGMLYTPILVDKLQLTFPSGLAVANILRALTDPRLLKRSVSTLGSGIGGGLGLTLLAEKGPAAIAAIVGKVHFSASTFGAGMIVGARIGVPAIFVGAIGVELTPWLRAEGLLGENDPFRKIGFIVALGTILGAAVVDLALIFKDAFGRIAAARRGEGPQAPASTQDSLSLSTLITWTALWGVLVVVAATQLLAVPVAYALLGVFLALIFVLINGISFGISDSNPISSAFVVSVLIMGAVGLTEPTVGLMAASILLVSTTVGCDMQQDRSTGFRLGSSRVIQFRFQTIGITMGALLSVFTTKLFLAAYPVLTVNLFEHPEQKVDQWQSAMTYKFVGALKNLGGDDGKTMKLLLMGLAVGFVIEAARKALFRSEAYRAWRAQSVGTKVADFILDAIVLASPYASSFGGFVDFMTSLWFGLGGIFSSIANFFGDRARATAQQHHATGGSPGEGEALPEDMSTTSLVGGGLIAGESLAALLLGLGGLIASGALSKLLG